MDRGETAERESTHAVAAAAAGSLPLWRHRDFLLLWSGQSVTDLGSAITQLALPLTAVIALKASAFQVGLLNAATYAAFALIALPAGAIVDRADKRRVLLVCDLARMIIIGSVPVAAAFGALTLTQLYSVALLAGVCTVFFTVSYQSYLPSLIPVKQLSDGNGKLGATQAFAQAAGPGLGGVLIGIAGAAQTMSADASSFALSVISLLLIRSRSNRPSAYSTKRDIHIMSGLRSDITEGLRFVVRHPILRKMVAFAGTSNLCSGAYAAVEMIFLVRVLHLNPALIGLLYAIGAVGGVAGGLFAGRLAQRIGSAKVFFASVLLFPLSMAVLPLAQPGWRIALVGISMTCVAFLVVLFNVVHLSYRQAITPPDLLGRMNAAVRWIVWGTLPLGQLAGGALGIAIGIRPTLLCGAAGSVVAAMFIVFSPLRSMRDFPSREEINAT
jgi:MFS family permease